MKRNFIFIALILLTSCRAPLITDRNASQNSGDDVQRHLTSRYADVRDNCGRASQPAFICSGILIRGTSYKAGRHSWDNSPANHTSGGVSFSYLRADSRYSKLSYGYTNGYIFLPYDHASGKVHPEILCSFPIDAGTSARTDKGCGAYSGQIGSGACQPQGVYTAQQWYAHYRSVTGNQRAHQCGFDVRDALNADATDAFNASIKAMTLLGSESFATQNELRLAVWPDGSGSTIPLEAFFYMDDSASGRVDAQNNQRDLFATNQTVIPVISAHFPTVATGSVSFKYIASDQVITLP